jgi:hypothetical protein
MQYLLHLWHNLPPLNENTRTCFEYVAAFVVLYAILHYADKWRGGGEA